MISISRKKNKYLFSPTYFFISIIILFFSCGSNQNLTDVLTGITQIDWYTDSQIIFTGFYVKIFVEGRFY